MKASVAGGMLTLLLMAAVSAWGKEGRAVVVYDDVATEVNPAVEESNQLWITQPDLLRATRFEVKPQGVCRDEICIPLPKARMQEFLRKGEGKVSGKNPGKNSGHNNDWFNLTAFAQLTRQPVAHDAAASVWYFGLRSDQRQALASLQAPDFTLPDINGKPHSLSDFRGKKVLLVTWASW